MKKNRWILGGTVAFLSAGLLIALPIQTKAATFPAGITIGGFDMTGMTREDADKKLSEHVDTMAAQQITLTIDSNEVSASAGDLGFTWTNEDAILEAAARYSGGNLLERYLDMKSLQAQPVTLNIETAVDEQKVSAFVLEKCTPFIRTPQDAAIIRENNQFIVSDSVEGLEVDVAATKAALDEALKAGLTEPVKVATVVKTSQPVRTKEALLTITDVLGTFKTGFNPGSVSRSKNLRNGAAKVNGTVLMPGEEFSAYTWLTPFTTANGYASAASYENGKVVDTVGGGACQLCTTLYNTALRAELEITQRQNHSMTVAYVKPSEDAAIAGTVKDLKFKNNYTTPIYIEGSVNGGTLTFTVYGKETRPANRTIEFVSETLGTINPGPPITKVDGSLRPGAQVREQSAHVGKSSRLWKVVYVDGVETERNILHTDSYMASRAIVRVGPAAAPVQVPPVGPAPMPVPQPVPETPAPAPQGPASDGPASDPGAGSGPAGPAGPAG